MSDSIFAIAINPPMFQRKSNRRLEAMRRAIQSISAFVSSSPDQKRSLAMLQTQSTEGMKWERMTQRKQELLKSEQPLSSFREIFLSSSFLLSSLSSPLIVERRHYPPYVCALKSDRSICDDDDFYRYKCR